MTQVSYNSLKEEDLLMILVDNYKENYDLINFIKRNKRLNERLDDLKLSPF
jgi:hypothetical protein